MAYEVLPERMKKGGRGRKEVEGKKKEKGKK